MLERLPNLQSLIVRGLPFFDHSALQAIKFKRPRVSQEDGRISGAIELPASQGFAFQRLPDVIPSFGLRLLDASRCSNVTSQSLAQALARFESLLYLDLSFTYPAREAIVLKTLKRFSGLQVLKLRGVHLHDDALNVLVSAIGRRVRSLDLRNNNITDRGVRVLLDECFISSDENGTVLQSGQRSPALLQYIGPEMLDIYQGENFESFIRSAFTGRFISRLAIEDTPEGGITHLYIAGNQISVEGVSGLLRAGRLHVFDAHSVVKEFATPLPTLSDEGSVEVGMPGVEKLTPIMAKYVSNSMVFLRIGHSIVTRDIPKLHADEVVLGRSELADTALPELPRHAAELDATSPRREVFEMPGVQTPRYELPGDPMQFIVSPARNDAPHTADGWPTPVDGPRRGSAFAPEVVDNLTAETGQMPLFSPVSPYEEGGTIDDSFNLSPLSPMIPFTPLAFETELARPNTRPRTYSSVADERKARLNAHHVSKQNLHPAMLPRLGTLVLTDVPAFSPTKDVSDRLVCFIRQCAEETQLAKAHAKVDYALPPGRRGHAAALKHSADKIFALKQLVLELAPEQSVRRKSRASLWHHPSTRSVTEDRDSESLWSAAETDFSFFGDEDYSFPSLESGRYAHSERAEKEVSFGNDYTSPSREQPPPLPAQPKFDNIALLSAFRKERKLAHQRNVAAGAVDPETAGYWEGIVRVIRAESAPFREDEAVDYYGNRFENGYLYR